MFSIFEYHMHRKIMNHHLSIVDGGSIIEQCFYRFSYLIVYLFHWRIQEERWIDLKWMDITLVERFPILLNVPLLSRFVPNMSFIKLLGCSPLKPYKKRYGLIWMDITLLAWKCCQKHTWPWGSLTHLFEISYFKN